MWYKNPYNQRFAWLIKLLAPNYKGKTFMIMWGSVWHSSMICYSWKGTCSWWCFQRMPSKAMYLVRQLGWQYYLNILEFSQCVFEGSGRICKPLIWFLYIHICRLTWQQPNTSRESRPCHSVTITKHCRIANKINNARLTLFC